MGMCDNTSALPFIPLTRHRVLTNLFPYRIQQHSIGVHCRGILWRERALVEILRFVRQSSQGLLVTRCADIQYLFLIAMMNLTVIYTGVYFVQLVSVFF